MAPGRLRPIRYDLAERSLRPILSPRGTELLTAVRERRVVMRERRMAMRANKEHCSKGTRP